jgi:predicted PilT family ATPase
MKTKNTPATASAASAAVVIYGPQGCGKSSNAEALAAFFKKAKVVDDWEPGSAIKLPDNVLALTSTPCDGAIKFADAMTTAGLNKKI